MRKSGFDSRHGQCVMKKKKQEKRMVVIIHWDDSMMLGTGQHAADDPEIRLAHGFSAGVLVKETKEYIALCLDEFDTGETNYRTVQTYPKSGIKSIKRFTFSV